MSRTLWQQACWLLCGVSMNALAEIPLYATGPGDGDNLAYVRYVNATAGEVTVLADKAKVVLNSKNDGRVSPFFAIKAGTKLAVAVQRGSAKEVLNVTGKPWEYLTVVAGADKSVTIRETPDDFNAMRASLALFNADAQCAEAMLQGGAKHTAIVDKVAPFSVQRRLVNPIKLTASVSCAGQAGQELDFAQLQAGERYSVFWWTLKNERKAFFVIDSK